MFLRLVPLDQCVHLSALRLVVIEEIADLRLRFLDELALLMEEDLPPAFKQLTVDFTRVVHIRSILRAFIDENDTPQWRRLDQLICQARLSHPCTEPINFVFPDMASSWSDRLKNALRSLLVSSAEQSAYTVESKICT